MDKAGFIGVNPRMGGGAFIVATGGPCETVPNNLAFCKSLDDVGAKPWTVFVQLVRSWRNHVEGLSVALENVFMRYFPAKGDGWGVGVTDGAVAFSASGNRKHASTGSLSGPGAGEKMIPGVSGVAAIYANVGRIFKGYGVDKLKMGYLGTYLGAACWYQIGQMGKGRFVVMHPKFAHLILVVGMPALEWPASWFYAKSVHMIYNNFAGAFIPATTAPPRSLRDAGRSGS